MSSLVVSKRKVYLYAASVISLHLLVPETREGATGS